MAGRRLASALGLGLGLGALPLAAAHAEYEPELDLHGACDEKAFLNNVRFAPLGHTASGAPFYKGTAQDGAVAYLYWDPDCGDGGDGTPRWILDDSAPSTTAPHDLDGDGACNYHARIDSRHKEFPPTEGAWQMSCGGAGSETVILDLLTVTTTVTSTTTSKTTTTTTSVSSTTTTSSTTSNTTSTTTTTSTTKTTSTTTATTVTETVTGTSTETATTTEYRLTVTLSGVCKFKEFLNGLTFREEGFTANGARFFKAIGEEQYIYYDEDCDGGGTGRHRWVIDEDRPDPAAVQDLDHDKKCNYHARIDTDDFEHLPAAGTWSVWCGLGWVQQVVHLDDAGNWTHDDDQEESSVLELRGNFERHQCQSMSFLSGLRFELQGSVANGSPYYKSESDGQFLYYDASCSGGPTGTARWIIDTDAPNVNAMVDLDGDRNCSYSARVKTNDGSAPPRGAMWHVFCGSRWEDLWLHFVRLPVTTTSVVVTDPPTTQAVANTTEHGHGNNSTTSVATTTTLSHVGTSTTPTAAHGGSGQTTMSSDGGVSQPTTTAAYAAVVNQAGGLVLSSSVAGLLSLALGLM